jgi:hypothetical protein
MPPIRAVGGLLPGQTKIAKEALTKEIHASRGAAADLNHTPTCGFARGSGPRYVLA